MGRNPNPIRLRCRPVTGAPRIAALMPNPTPWDPGLVGRRRGNVGTRFDRRGRLGQVFDLAHLRIGPVSGSPLSIPPRLAPITGHPLATWRQRAPNAADPQEIVPLVIPAPVAGYPRDVLPFGSLIGRQFLDGGRRRFGNHDAWFGIEGHGFRKCLMHRPAREHFHAFLGVRWARFRGDRFVQAKVRANGHQCCDHAQHASTTGAHDVFPLQNMIHPTGVCNGSRFARDDFIRARLVGVPEAR